MTRDPDHGLPPTNTIRKYLLGRLDDQKELEKALSEQILYDDELSEMVEGIEDEIIEDYLDGTLSNADQQAVERYFLRPEERKTKLHFASLLQRHFQAGIPAVAGGKEDTGTGSDLTPVAVINTHHDLMFHFRSHLRTYCELSALLLFSTASLIYMMRIHQQTQFLIDNALKNQKVLEGKLAQEREVAASLARQLQEFAPPASPLPFVLGISRGPGAEKRVEIKPFTQRIHVEFDLRGASANVYDVRLISEARKEIWTATSLRPSSGVLSFEVPVQGLTKGDYHLTVTSQPGNHSTGPYYFHADVLK